MAILEDIFARPELPVLSLGVFGPSGSGARTLLEALARASAARGWGPLSRAPPRVADAKGVLDRLLGRTAARRYLWTRFTPNQMTRHAPMARIT